MKWNKVIGWILFLLAIGLLCLQMGYLFVSARSQVEYIDNRLFYVINILCVLGLFLVVLVLCEITKSIKIIAGSIVIIFMIVQVALLVSSNEKIKNITNISPDWKHVFAVKENTLRGEAVYYRSHYRILARPKESLPFQTVSDFKVEWLAGDIAAVTYKTAEDTTQQFIGTYGDRGEGGSYYYVGAEMYGKWQGEGVTVVSDSEGITVTENGLPELFEWENVPQFGTLAVVLKKDNEAVWTIALAENFLVQSGAANHTSSNIILYKATMEENQPIILHYEQP